MSGGSHRAFGLYKQPARKALCVHCASQQDNAICIGQYNISVMPCIHSMDIVGLVGAGLHRQVAVRRARLARGPTEDKAVLTKQS